MTYDNIKSHQKAGLHPLSKKPTFGKTTGYVKFRLKIPKENLKAQKDLALYNSCSH